MPESGVPEGGVSESGLPERRCLIALALLLWSAPAFPQSVGETIFTGQCTSCHAAPAAESRAPTLEALRLRAPEAVMNALLDGAMRVQGSRLSAAERRTVAEYVTGKALGGDLTGASKGRCTTSAPFTMPAGDVEWNGWGGTIANHRFQPARGAGISESNVSRLTLKWAFGYPDASQAWAQPTVMGGRLFVGSQSGMVYSLDAKSGCIHWVFPAVAGVRTAMVIGRTPGGGATVYFGDTIGNLYAVDASTGKQRWIRKLGEHPMIRVTGTPTLHDGRLYIGTSSYEEAGGRYQSYECCTFRGSLMAVDAATGRVVWNTYVMPVSPTVRGKNPSGVSVYGPSGAAIWSSPTIDVRRGRVYVGTGNSYTGPPQPESNAIMAFDLKTGKVAWSRQLVTDDVFIVGCPAGTPPCPEVFGPDYDFAQAAMLVTLPSGKDLLIAGQKSGIGWALDPDARGAVVWQYKAGEGSAAGGMEWGSATDGENAYFAVADGNRPKPGGLHAVRLDTGKAVWTAMPGPALCAQVRGCSVARPAAVTAIPGLVFSGTLDGGFRAHSTKDGHVAWEYDTNREFETVNGIKANGASINSGGPVISGGMVYTNSGYGFAGGRPGNVLLAFGVD